MAAWTREKLMGFSEVCFRDNLCHNSVVSCGSYITDEAEQRLKIFQRNTKTTTRSTSIGENVRKGNPCAATMENSLEVPQKIKNRSTL